MLPAKPEPIAIAIMAKAPIPGHAKTRLVPALAPEAAADLQAHFVERTVATALVAAIGPVTLWASPDQTHPAFRQAARAGVALARQPIGDLGARMAAALGTSCPALVVGVDCPALTTDHLRMAAEALRDGLDAVVIPTEDGGYVLIGLQRPQPHLFTDMAWGADTVMAETRRRLAQSNLTWREPAQLWDVDVPADLERMRAAGFGNLLNSARAPAAEVSAA
jgi:rSAM/selenodomain-associated transferase 1